MKKFTYSMFLFIGMAAAYSQSFEWVKTPAIDLSINMDRVGYSTAIDPSGNIFFTGYKDNQSSNGGMDIMGNLYFNKYAPNGELMLTKTIGGAAASHTMVTDSQGNVILALSFANLITYDDFSLAKQDQDNHWLIMKLDNTGNLLWQQEVVYMVDGINWMSDFRAISLDTNDNIYIGYDTFQNSCIKKLSPEGADLLTITQESVNRITSVSVDNEGNIYSAGSCANINSVFAGVAFGTDLQYNIYAAKYSADGQWQWVKYVEDITCSEPQIAARTPDEVYFSSYLYGSVIFDCWMTEGPVDNFEDFFVAKLTSWSSVEWIREVPGSGYAGPGNRNFLTFDDEGNVYFSGYTHGDVNWGDGFSTEADFAVHNALIVKYSPWGEVKMVKTAGGDGYNRVDGISVNSAGEVYISGMANGNIAFDDITFESTVFDSYPFLAKLGVPALGINKPQAAKIAIYPNPAKDMIYLSGPENIKGTIFNALGQKIETFESVPGSPIDVSALPMGSYIMRLSGFESIKFIKN
jgi:hypothetical protein